MSVDPALSTDEIAAIAEAAYVYAYPMLLAYAFFPVAMSSFFVILHTRLGGPAAASTAAHVPAALFGLGVGLFVVHYSAVPFGVWWSYLAGLAICIGWNALLWGLRQRRLAT